MRDSIRFNYLRLPTNISNFSIILMLVLFDAGVLIHITFLAIICSALVAFTCSALVAITCSIAFVTIVCIIGHLVEVIKVSFSFANIAITENFPISLDTAYISATNDPIGLERMGVIEEL